MGTGFCTNEKPETSAALSERDGKIRLSFRSKGQFAINSIAQNYFDGGGHVNAAGGNSELSLDDTIIKLKERMKEQKDELIKSDAS